MLDLFIGLYYRLGSTVVFNISKHINVLIKDMTVNEVVGFQRSTKTKTIVGHRHSMKIDEPCSLNLVVQSNE